MYYKHNGLEVKAGNRYINKNTLILNMGTSSHCPAKVQGLCPHPSECYAWKNELQYDATYQYRMRQADYWLSHQNAGTIYADLTYIITAKIPIKGARAIRFLRINESGDFYSQKCVDKLTSIAHRLKLHHNITTYGFTARRDLDYRWLNNEAIITGSDFETDQGIAAMYRNSIEKIKLKRLWRITHPTKHMFHECEGKCGTSCFKCMRPTVPEKKLMVLFKKHGNGLSKSELPWNSLDL